MTAGFSTKVVAPTGPFKGATGKFTVQGTVTDVGNLVQ